MNLKVATARWFGSIEDLEPGSLFIHDGKIAVKMNQDHFSFEPCNCVVVGTGDNLFDFTVDETEFNKTIVTKILLYDDKSREG